MPVQVQIAKWGNSLGLRAPRDIAARVGLAEGSRVDIEATDDGRIIITRSRRRFTLEELLAGMTPNRSTHWRTMLRRAKKLSDGIARPGQPRLAGPFTAGWSRAGWPSAGHCADTCRLSSVFAPGDRLSRRR